MRANFWDEALVALFVLRQFCREFAFEKGGPHDITALFYRFSGTAPNRCKLLIVQIFMEREEVRLPVRPARRQCFRPV